MLEGLVAESQTQLGETVDWHDTRRTANILPVDSVGLRDVPNAMSLDGNKAASTMMWLWYYMFVELLMADEGTDWYLQNEWAESDL